MGYRGDSIQRCPDIGFINTLYFIIHPGAQVFIGHPGMIKTFNREKAVSEIGQQKD